MKIIVDWIANHNIVIFALLIFIVLVLWLAKFEKKLKIQLSEAVFVSLAHVIIGWSCMKLLALIEVGFDFEKAANIRVFGAVFTLPFMYYIWAKRTDRNVELVMDLSAICVVLGVVSGRMNCLTQGCCQGIPLFFNQEWRWPLREIELVFYVIFIIYYRRKIQKQETHGQVYPIYMIAYGVLRFLCEFVREEFTTQVGFLRLAHIWSLISLVSGIVWLFYVEKRKNSIRIRNNRTKRQIQTSKEGKL